MKKVFLFIIGIEAAIVVLTQTVLRESCGSACSNYSLLNPFGAGETGRVCIMSCANNPHPLFYITFDLLILTVVVFGIYMIVKKGKNG